MTRREMVLVAALAGSLAGNVALLSRRVPPRDALWAPLAGGGAVGLVVEWGDLAGKPFAEVSDDRAVVAFGDEWEARRAWQAGLKAVIEYKGKPTSSP